MESDKVIIHRLKDNSHLWSGSSAWSCDRTGKWWTATAHLPWNSPFSLLSFPLLTSTCTENRTSISNGTRRHPRSFIRTIIPLVWCLDSSALKGERRMLRLQWSVTWLQDASSLYREREREREREERERERERWRRE